jgi:hypothetical protein
VLDGAISSGQVRPLLPGAPDCTMIVTSRHYLADLIVRDGADGIVVDVLPAESSAALLGHVAGSARVEAEPEAAAAAACGHLPLALRLASAVLAGAPDRSFAELVEELTTGDRLTALEGLARPSAVEDVFELSYRVPWWTSPKCTRAEGGAPSTARLVRGPGAGRVGSPGQRPRTTVGRR